MSCLNVGSRILLLFRSFGVREADIAQLLFISVIMKAANFVIM